MYNERYNTNDSTKPVKKNKIPRFLRIPLIVVCTLLALIIIVSSIKIIPEGYVGVKYRVATLVDTSIGAGPHVCIPFIEKIRKIDVREQVYEAQTTAYTKDTQTVENIAIKVNYSYSTDKLDVLIRTIGVNNVESKLIMPQLNSVLKNEVGKYKAEELVQNRSALQESVEDSLRSNLEGYGVVVTALNIIDVDFEDSFEQTIREKVAAEQEAQKVKNETVKKEELAKQEIIAAEANAQAKKIEADADAYAIKVVQEQLDKSPNYNDYIRAQAWDGHLPEVMDNTVNPFVTMGN